jgi:biopolymer transport protein ExbB
MEPGLGFAHFLSKADGVDRLVLVLLSLLSLVCWYQIAARTVFSFLARRNAQAYLTRFNPIKILLIDAANSASDGGALASLVDVALDVRKRAGSTSSERSGEFGEVLTRCLNHSIDLEMAKAEEGMTLLATISATAPYIGLFGTVWGIYHALLEISAGGQGTLDKVAGPVGEALIMTALGLVVAIPASLGYNILQRRNRIWLSQLESFSHQLFLTLTVPHDQG